jgi:hypothetical protein
MMNPSVLQGAQHLLSQQDECADNASERIRLSGTGEALEHETAANDEEIVLPFVPDYVEELL